jgi:probable HAF family extracellular repeat protein
MRSSAKRRIVVSLFLGALAGVATPSQALPSYSITDLGAPPGASSVVTGINNHGQVVGTSNFASDSHASIFGAGTITDLGTPTGSGPIASSYGNGINDAGQVVGYSTVSRNDPTTRGFVYEGGTMRDIGTLGGASSYAYAINNAGQVVGGSNITPPRPGPFPHPFLYNNGVMTDLGGFGGLGSALDINNRGQIVGFSEFGSVPGPGHAFLYSGGIMTDIGTLSGSARTVSSTATGINDRGQIVGYSDTPALSGAHAFIYNDGTMVDMGTLGGNTSFARDINNLGQVVGESAITGNNATHAFLFSDGVMEDLNSLANLQAAGWSLLTNANGINNNGQLVGIGFPNGASSPHSFLLTLNAEVPEPPVVLLWLVGALALYRITRSNARKSDAQTRN